MPAVKRERAVRRAPRHEKIEKDSEYEPVAQTSASASPEPAKAEDEDEGAIVESITSALETPTTSEPRRFPSIPDSILHPLLLVILNLSLSTAATALAAQYIGDEIGKLQNDVPEEYWWYIVPGWKALKALGAWWGGFDTLDTSFLTFLSLAPTTHFLATFNPSLSAYTHASTVAISTLSLTLPMYLLRSKVSPDSKNHHHHHHHHHRKHHKSTSYMDKSTYITTGLLASSIYASIMYTSLKTFLTSMIVAYFPSIGLRKGTGLVESVEGVYHPTPMFWGLAGPIGFAVAKVVLGRALRELQEPLREEEEEEEDGKLNGLLKRIWDWFSPRGKTVIKRTAWVGGYMGVDTLVRLAGVMRGGSLLGAAVVSGVWVGATVVTGLVYGWIGKE